MAEARAKAEAVAAKLGAGKSASPGTSQSPPSAAPPPQSAAERLAAMRSRVANAVSRATASAPPRPAVPTAPTMLRREEPEQDEASKARGGLDVGLHPALLGDAADTGSRRGKVQPKFATTMANRRTDTGRGGKQKKQLDLSLPPLEETDPTKNPYYDPNINAKTLQPRRIPKALVFNPKGKYIEQANALRRQEALEEMKKRIAAAARKVGIDEDMHADKAFAVSTPRPFSSQEWSCQFAGSRTLVSGRKMCGHWTSWRFDMSGRRPMAACARLPRVILFLDNVLICEIAARTARD